MPENNDSGLLESGRPRFKSRADADAYLDSLSQRAGYRDFADETAAIGNRVMGGQLIGMAAQGQGLSGFTGGATGTGFKQVPERTIRNASPPPRGLMPPDGAPPNAEGVGGTSSGARFDPFTKQWVGASDGAPSPGANMGPPPVSARAQPMEQSPPVSSETGGNGWGGLLSKVKKVAVGGGLIGAGYHYAKDVGKELGDKAGTAAAALLPDGVADKINAAVDSMNDIDLSRFPPPPKNRGLVKPQ